MDSDHSSLKNDIESQTFGHKCENLSAPESKRMISQSAKALGIFSFSVTTTIISLINVQAGGVTIPNVVVGVGTWHRRLQNW